MSDSHTPPPFAISSDPPPPRAPDPPPSSASSKRRWSPCTWRYAIEEVQPELGSKPRSSYILPAPSAARDRERAPPDGPKKAASPDKAGEGPQNGCDQSPSRQSLDKGGAHKKQQQEPRDAEEPEERARKSAIQRAPGTGQKDGELGGVEERGSRRKEGDAPRRRAAAEEEEDSSRRRRREMTPSELYFCEVCAARASGSPGEDCC